MGPTHGYDHASLIARLALAFVAASLAWGAATAAAGPGTPQPPDLTAKLGAALHAKGIGPQGTGAVAVDLTTGQVLFAHNSATGFVPASNEKLPVSYAALKVLGPSFRFPTEVRGQGSLGPDGTWTGNLVLKGYGDPTLSSARLRSLARRVRSLGITRVTGLVIGDESYFDKVRTAPGWKADFFIAESPPLSALVLDRDWNGKRYSLNPAYAAADTFRTMLIKAGVKVDGKARSFQAGGKVLAVTFSQPLSAILHAVDADSDNFTAELLLKELGAVAGSGGTTAAGATVVDQVLQENGIPLDGVRIVDGSGLSSLDRLTPQAIVAILEQCWKDGPLRSTLVQAMAVAGQTGTLVHRLLGPRTRGSVIGKTGTTDLASVLSGFVRGRYAFSVIENGAPVPWWTARTAQDKFVQLLAAAS
ncbi:MAG TPA: D-alanyl-D-alanine carboxypeptidase/D-alanyl-D-alanine-endopeptidase [Gaiellaceae bacterium]|nr:D-alanyl-D-alanine carboxypeptidase/D-alanyl-D-alanine-endopeptidase [Gaiellaceae bacterium]